MTKIIVDMAMGEEALISTQRKRNYKIPPFQCIGASGMSKFKIKGLDLPPIVKNLSKPANHFFWQAVEDKSSETNEVVIRGKSLSKSQKNQLSRVYAELHKANLIKRVKREHYMVNPKAALPNFNNFESCWTQWENLP